MRKSNQILSKIKSMKELTILSIIIVFVIVISVKSPVFKRRQYRDDSDGIIDYKHCGNRRNHCLDWGMF